MVTVIRAGTSGYSYKEWRGPFYPEKLASDEWLGYYASRLPAVEINNTFYRMPRAHVVEGWRDSVPASFRFVIKASRRITHQGRLKNVEEPLGYLLERAALLGEKLGAVLFQLPPQMRADLARLQAFQALLPDSLPAAFEFRHASWREDAIDEALEARGHARVVAHAGEDAAEPLLASSLAYLRLRASDYADRDLRAWRERIVASSADHAFVFFKHEDAGGGPRMAARFMALSEEERALPGRAGPKRAAWRKAPSAAGPGRRTRSSTAAATVASPKVAGGKPAAGETTRASAAPRKAAGKKSPKRSTGSTGATGGRRSST